MLSNQTIGRIEAVLASLVASFAFYFIKSSPGSFLALAYWRSVLNMIPLYYQGVYFKEELFGSWHKLDMCHSRGLLGMFSVMSMMAANKYLSLSVYSVVSRLNIFGVILLNVIYLKNKVSWLPIMMACVSFFGILLIVVPQAFGFAEPSSSPPGDTESSTSFFNMSEENIFGAIAAISFILSNSMARTVTSQISNEVGLTQSVFFLSFWVGILSSVLMVVFGEVILFPSSWFELFSILGMSLGTYLFQILFTDSNRREPDPSVLSLLQSSVVVFSTAIDVVFLGAQLKLTHIIGAVLVITGTVGALWSTKKQKPQDTQEKAETELVEPTASPNNK